MVGTTLLWRTHRKQGCPQAGLLFEQLDDACMPQEQTLVMALSARVQSVVLVSVHASAQHTVQELLLVSWMEQKVLFQLVAQLANVITHYRRHHVALVCE